MAEARDGYVRYLSEKIWELLPAVHRDEDGLGEKPGQLRALVEILGAHAAHLRRSQDRLWDDQFVDLADDWTIPYLADLVATRLVSALNLRGRRVDVAKTIYYRRRKGTPRVLEELIADITGWEGKLVEQWKRLGRMRHGLDPAPGPFVGRFTHTPPGGLADLRRPRGAELAGGPFDEFHYTPDMRRPRGRSGRYGIRKIAFHLYRLQAVDLTGVMPHRWADPAAGQRAYNVDPSGRDVPLFMSRKRAPDWDEWKSALEWELPAPMRCRVLGHSEYLLGPGEVLAVRTSAALAPAVAMAAADELAPFAGTRFASEAALRRLVATLPSAAAIFTVGVFRPLLETALVPDCGKAALLPAPPGTDPADVRVQLGGATIQRSRTTAGNLSTFAALAMDKALVIDPERGRLLFLGAPAAGEVVLDHLYGFSGPVGAGGYDRSSSILPETVPVITGGGAMAAAAVDLAGVTTVGDSATYGPIPDLGPIDDVTLQAADRQRPYLTLDSGHTSWRFTAPAGADANLTIDGLWVGGQATVGAATVVLAGDYERVVLRHITLDPGGSDATGAALSPVVLVVEGTIETLEIGGSIVAAVRTDGAGSIESLRLLDSIVDASNTGAAALPLPATAVHVERSTVVGDVDVDALYATDSIFDGVVDVTNTQTGCFRFSAARTGSRVPHPYESVFLDETPHLFSSRRFGDPTYLQLSAAAPQTLHRGAENGSEMGVWSSLLTPIKRDGLRAKVDEYAPFGLLPIFIDEPEGFT